MQGIPIMGSCGTRKTWWHDCGIRRTFASSSFSNAGQINQRADLLAESCPGKRGTCERQVDEKHRRAQRACDERVGQAGEDNAGDGQGDVTLVPAAEEEEAKILAMRRSTPEAHQTRDR